MPTMSDIQGFWKRMFTDTHNKWLENSKAYFLSSHCGVSFVLNCIKQDLTLTSVN